MATFSPSIHRKSLFLIVVLLSLAAFTSACKSSGGPTPTPSQQPTVTPTSAPLVQIDDSGEPLPPKVIGQNPSGGQELAPDGSVVLTFDQAMDLASAEKAWQIVGPDGKKVPGKISWPTGRTLQFTPDQHLALGSTYLASLSTGATSSAGVALADPVQFEFNTVGELQISQVFPADGSQEIANNAVITVIFNRPVVPLVINEEQGSLPQPLEIDPATAGQGEWVSTSVYAFRPDKPLRGSTTYSVTVKSGLADAVQASSLDQDFAWQFTTVAPSIASYAISNGEVNPQDNYQDLLLDAYFTINFYQPMDPASTEAFLALTSTSGEPAGLTTAWNEDDTRVVITPTQQLALGTTYDLVLAPSAQAASGGALQAGLNWRFTTVPYPAVVSSQPANGSRQPNYNGWISIKFASPMQIDTVKPRILVSPSPAEDIQWFWNVWDNSISAYFLEPSTSYQIQLQPGMEDIYGNPTLQMTTIRFTTAAVEPQAHLQMPYQASMFRAGQTQQFYVTHTNVSQVKVQLYKITPEQFVSFQNGQRDQWNYSPSEADLVWQSSRTIRAVQNQRVLDNLQMSGPDGGPLPPGFYFMGLNASPVSHQGPYVDTRLLAVASANLTFKTDSNEALIWATDLESGAPLANVPLTVYDNKFNAIGSGSSDAHGLLQLDLPAPEDPYSVRYVMSGAQDPQGAFGFASSDLGSGVSLWDYGIGSSFYAPPEQPTGYIYTERPIYRPGQPVYFKGIVRLDDDLDYHLPDQSQVEVQITSFEETVYNQTLNLSEYGSFDGVFTLDNDAALGSYTIMVKFPGQQDPFAYLDFSVAEYRRPEFQVAVSSPQTDVLSGDNFDVNVAADFYSGGGVSEASVDWTLTAQPYTFQPGGDLSRYSFTDPQDEWVFYNSPQPPSLEVIASGQGQTDGDGKLKVTLPADLSESKTSRQLTIEASVTDLAGNVVSGRTSVTAHLSSIYPGVAPQTYVGQAGKPQGFDLIAVDWDGNPLAGQSLDVEIVERRWYSVQEQDATGRIQWKSSVEEIPVTSFSAIQTDAKGEASVSFTPDKGGAYRARVTVTDPQGNQAKASTFLWVAGKDYIPWRQTNDRTFDLIADRTQYSPGDTAEILIASPFQGDAYALVTVERGRIRYSDVVRLTSNSTIYKLPIESSMSPNVYVSVLIVKGVDDTNLRPDFKMGIVELQVDRDERALQIELTSDKPQAGPGEQVQYNLKVTDYQGQPVSAELSLSLSDLATLSLRDPNSAPILDYFYSKRSLGVWTSVPIVNAIDDYNASIEEYLAQGQGMGSGGGKGGGDFAVIEVRQDFPDTAFWDAHLVTDASGQASVKVTLPDNLTTWRMDARAVTEDTRVGQTTLDVLSTRPLLVSPQTPRFLVVGDQVRLGASVHNNTEQAISARVTLAGQGIQVQGDLTQNVDIPAHRQAYVSWDAMVDFMGADGRPLERLDLLFSAEGGGFQDASRPTLAKLEGQGLPVYRYEAHETVGTSGVVPDSGTQVEAISLPAGWTDPAAHEGSLTVEMAPSLAAGMTDGLEFLKEYPYECIEQTVSRFLPNVLTTSALKAAGLSNPSLEANLNTQVNTALQRLYNLQNPDGGWGWWSNQKSDPLTSAYVVFGLLEARDAGYTVAENPIANGLKFLNSQLRSLPALSEPYQVQRQSFLLYVLARAGQPDVNRTGQLYENRQELAIYARAYLLQTLFWIDPQDPRLQTLLSDFNSDAIVSASGTHWEEANPDPYNWNTNTRTTAIVLSAISQVDPQNPLNANATRWLMSNRTQGHWDTTQETAWTILALTKWMVTSGELQANYHFGVAVNGQTLGEGTANSTSLRQTFTYQVQVAQLLADEVNRLAIARDEGPGDLYYTAHLDVSLPVEEIQALDQGIIVSHSYFNPDERTQPISAASVGDLLLVRLTVVAPNDLHYVVIDDPLPAGLEALDQSLNTSEQAVTPQQYDWQDLSTKGWGWWYFNHTELRDEKLVLSADFLPAGTYVYSYLVRASTAGEFRTIPPTAQEFYFPEVYGRGDGSLFTVNP